jgi:thiamine-phosphate pyrophosphorylase
MRIDEARLYLVIGDRLDVAEAALRGGVDVIQLRVKDRSDEELLPVARELRRLCAAYGALFIVNDSPTLAVTADADGVHVGQEDTPLAEARRVVGPDRLVGVSTHSAEEIAAAAGADYLGVGPVFETPTKPGATAVGLELVREAARSARVPWFAIGGIGETTLPDVLASGAVRIAVVRAIADAPDPESAARSLRGQLERSISRAARPS